jgi:hypothetical protein
VLPAINRKKLQFLKEYTLCITALSEIGNHQVVPNHGHETAYDVWKCISRRGTKYNKNDVLK